MFKISQLRGKVSGRFIHFVSALILLGLISKNLAWSQLPDVPPAKLNIQHVGHVIGLEGIKSNLSGDLVFDETTMQFKSDAFQSTVKLKSIRAFSMARDNVALISGAKGVIVSMAPFGVGLAASAVRPSVDTFTFLYTDQNEGIHGAILLLPTGRGEEVTRKLATFALTPSAYPKTGTLDNPEVESKSEVNKELVVAHDHTSVEVNLLSESIDGVPAAFPIAVYENLVADLEKSEIFGRVWRQGDKRIIHSDSLVLHVNIKKLKRGSARSRAMLPFTGATVVNIEVQLSDDSGHILFQKEVDAAKRMRGENLEVTKGLSKKVCHEIAGLPELKKSTSKGKMD